MIFRGPRVFRVYCLTMHMTLINFLNFVIVNDHFDCRLSQWHGNNE
jgi:hypothetical protein